MNVLLILLLIIVPIITGVISYRMGEKRGIDKWGSFCLGFFFSIIGIMLVLLLAIDKAMVYKETYQDKDKEL